MTITGVLEWLEATAPAVLIQQSAYGFVIAVAIHLLGLTLSVGTLLWVDLRMLGLAVPRASLQYVYRSLAPWFLAGFAVMLTSGAALFAAFASSAYANLYFRIKMAALVLAAVNALVFHFAVARQSANDGRDELEPSAAVRAAGLTSLLLWAVVILCGRMMSYTIF
jgi:hypothetical protein